MSLKYSEVGFSVELTSHSSGPLRKYIVGMFVDEYDEVNGSFVGKSKFEIDSGCNTSNEASKL